MLTELDLYSLSEIKDFLVKGPPTSQQGLWYEQRYDPIKVVIGKYTEATDGGKTTFKKALREAIEAWRPITYKEKNDRVLLDLAEIVLRIEDGDALIALLVKANRGLLTEASLCELLGKITDNKWAVKKEKKEKGKFKQLIDNLSTCKARRY